MSYTPHERKRCDYCGAGRCMFAEAPVARVMMCPRPVSESDIFAAKASLLRYDKAKHG